MANRYVYFINQEDFNFQKEDITFKWYPGFSKEQKQKSMMSLHEAFLAQHKDVHILEVSSKSKSQTGIQASAFHLNITTQKGHELTVEQVFQSSKVYKYAGSQNYLLEKGFSARDMKKKLREIDTSDYMVKYHCFGRDFPLEPKTIFYNWLYINALTQNPEVAEALLKYDAFTDIEFNPKRSYNCQAEACSIYVSLHKRGLLDKALNSIEDFKKIVYTK